MPRDLMDSVRHRSEPVRLAAFLYALLLGRIQINGIFYDAGYVASNIDDKSRNPHRRWTVQWWSWRRGYWDCVADDLYTW